MGASNTFEGEIAAESGSILTLAATDLSGNARTNTYRLPAASPTITYTYDANGNLATKDEGSDVWSYAWNARNELVTVAKNGSVVARFAYDPLGRRIQKVAGDVSTSYVYDGEDIIRETRSNGTGYRYIHGPRVDEPLVRIDNLGNSNYYHADGLGSIVKMTNDAGNIIAAYDYNAWGELMPGSAAPDSYGFTGREWDQTVGLWYYRARYYDSEVGRFISEDPLNYRGGDVNLYSYVGNNPVNWKDPSGKNPLAAVGALFGAGTLPAWVGPALIATATVMLAIGVYEAFLKPMLAKSKEAKEAEEEATRQDQFDQDTRKPARKKKAYEPTTRKEEDAPTPEDTLKDIRETQDLLRRAGRGEKIRDISKSEQNFDKSPKSCKDDPDPGSNE
jgi:RHS repeat-associated protein